MTAKIYALAAIALRATLPTVILALQDVPPFLLMVVPAPMMLSGVHLLKMQVLAPLLSIAGAL